MEPVVEAVLKVYEKTRDLPESDHDGRSVHRRAARTISRLTGTGGKVDPAAVRAWLKERAKKGTGDE